ncbi:SDR family oxidoreductase [Bacteroidota bacterium]
MDHKTVIITGSSSGIGHTCAREFNKRGYNVVIASRSIDKLNWIVKNELEENRSLAVKTDVSNEEDCKNLISKTIDRFGRIDVLINNAGISMRALFNDVNLIVIRKLMEVNFFGTVYCTKYALPHLIYSKGSLVGISSIAGFHGLPGRSGYSASKFAMNGFLETLRIENYRNGLHVMIVAPSFTSSNIRKSALLADGNMQGDSPRTEEKMMSAEEVAHSIYKGVKYKKRNIILTKEGKFTVLVQRIVPHMLDRIFYWQMAKEPGSPFK